jgi:hypothetical protein
MIASSAHHQSSRSSVLWEIFLAIPRLGVAGIGGLIADLAYFRWEFTTAWCEPSPPARLLEALEPAPVITPAVPAAIEIEA